MGNGKIKFYTAQPLDKTFYNIDEVVETDEEYVLDGEEYVLNDEIYKEKQEQKERERIAKLFLTGADVERGIYQAKGMDFDDILAFVTQLQPQGLDIKALKIELKANNFYRGNPYVSAIGALLGFTDEQLDMFFETNDYTVLLPKEEAFDLEEIEKQLVNCAYDATLIKPNENYEVTAFYIVNTMPQELIVNRDVTTLYNLQTHEYVDGNSFSKLKIKL